MKLMSMVLSMLLCAPVIATPTIHNEPEVPFEYLENYDRFPDCTSYEEKNEAIAATYARIKQTIKNHPYITGTVVTILAAASAAGLAHVYDVPVKDYTVLAINNAREMSNKGLSYSKEAINSIKQAINGTKEACKRFFSSNLPEPVLPTSTTSLPEVLTTSPGTVLPTPTTSLPEVLATSPGTILPTSTTSEKVADALTVAYQKLKVSAIKLGNETSDAVALAKEKAVGVFERAKQIANLSWFQKV